MAAISMFLLVTNSIFRKELNHFLNKSQDNTPSYHLKIEMDTYRVEN